MIILFAAKVIFNNHFKKFERNKIFLQHHCMFECSLLIFVPTILKLFNRYALYV